jgi:hypothetical protein
MPQEEIKVRRALLDAERVYGGLSQPLALEALEKGDFVFGPPAAKDALPEGVVYVERDCDLPPGKYRLAAPTREHPCWHFVPLADEFAQSLEMLLAHGLTLAQAEFSSPGALGRAAREYYALAHRHFPDVVANHLKRARAQ